MSEAQRLSLNLGVRSELVHQRAVSLPALHVPMFALEMGRRDARCQDHRPGGAADQRVPGAVGPARLLSGWAGVRSGNRELLRCVGTGLSLRLWREGRYPGILNGSLGTQGSCGRGPGRLIESWVLGACFVWGGGAGSLGVTLAGRGRQNEWDMPEAVTLAGRPSRGMGLGR